MSGLLLECVEGLESSLFVATAGEIWETLQSEKEEVSRDLMADESLYAKNVGIGIESEASEKWVREIERRHREQLEARLKEIIEAQDRLLDGKYGLCAKCGEWIAVKRLLVTPTVTLCIGCEMNAKNEIQLNALTKRIQFTEFKCKTYIA